MLLLPTEFVNAPLFTKVRPFASASTVTSPDHDAPAAMVSAVPAPLRYAKLSAKVVAPPVNWVPPADVKLPPVGAEKPPLIVTPLSVLPPAVPNVSAPAFTVPPVMV